MISEYKFGKMVIDGQAYFHDVIVTPEGVLPEWWRKESHRLAVEDIQSVVVSHRPEVLVVGTGKFGMMKIPEETRRWLEKEGVTLVAERTTRAVQIYNDLSRNQRVVGAFHLTC